MCAEIAVEWTYVKWLVQMESEKQEENWDDVPRSGKGIYSRGEWSGKMETGDPAVNRCTDKLQESR